ncbi:hypothetical protein [Brucella lupini]|uniref:Uncharacterized protein n=1 Tax=Brucella lupini TaxID=255457 RepID=A0A256GGP0_9HYPH|nr:hypothetical protein [Brucella lupini]OYR26293.1 hypothetical protein CES86_3761 [Brucella lupini]
MAIRPDYNIGELTLVAGEEEFTTSGSALQTAAIQAGDSIIAPSGHVLIIASITGQNSGTLFLPCPAAAAGTDLPLRIRFQPDGSRYQGAVRVLIDLLSSGNLEAFAALVGSAGLVPIFTGVGTMDLADPATFGIQDPNGTLAQVVTNGAQASGFIGGPTLSLTQGVPLPSSDVVGASTIYVIPSPSNLVELYDGQLWRSRSFSAFSLSIAGYGASTAYDVYAFLDGENVGFGCKSWASSTDRGTGGGSAEVSLFQGRVVNRYAISLASNGSSFTIPAQKATLIGSFLTSGAGITDDSASNRLLSNLMNVANKDLLFQWPDASWSGSGAQWVKAKNGNGFSRVRVFQCMAGRRLNVDVVGHGRNASSATEILHVAIGINSTNPVSQIGSPAITTNGTTARASASFNGAAAIGVSEYIWLEYAINGSSVWTGVNGGTKSGMIGGVII